MKFSSLKDLKVIKKNMMPDSSKTPAVPAGPGKIVRRSKEERKARPEGLMKGRKVRMMDSNETGTIVGSGKDYCEVEMDGLVVRLAKGDFYLIDTEEDRKLRNAIPSKRAEQEVEPVHLNDSGDLKVDLHMERIPGNENVPEWAALEFQLNYFRQVLRQNLKHRGRRIVFIHGVGDGTLAAAIRKELDEVYAVSCTYTVGTFGVTNVTIR